MAHEKEPTAEPQVTFASGRVDDGGSADSPPDVRIIHYNDVYHLDPSSAEPVGGLPRFITLCREYQEGKQYEGQPEALTLFSGDAFNPSLESSVTKGQYESCNWLQWYTDESLGQHMVPVLNMIGTDCACVGVGKSSYPGPIRRTNTASRTTILTSASSSTSISRASATSPGFSPTSLIPPWARTCPWATPRRRT